MTRNPIRLLFCVALLALSGAATLLQAQTTSYVSAVPFYRFRVSNTDLGYLYTASYQEGANAGFTPDGLLHNSNGIIGYIVVPPTPDATPVAGQGLQPLHRWRVIEDGRTYYYLSPGYGTLGGNYTYEGIAGYTYNLYDGGHPGLTFTAYYSQDYGYWFALNGERPPDASVDYSPWVLPECDFTYQNPANGLYYCSSYNNHGSICKLLQNQGGSFAFTTPPPPPPPPPPGSCNTPAGIKAKCSQYGGWWSDETCSCEY